MVHKNYTELRHHKSPHSTRFDIYTIAVFFLALFHIIANGIWHYLNTVTPTFDAAYHTIASLQFYDYVATNSTHFDFLYFIRITKFYPPLVHWAGTILAALGGFKSDIVQLTGTLFFALSIFAIYVYADALYKNKRIAFFAAFFYSFFIFIYKESREHMLDIPMTFLYMSALYMLYRSRLFSLRTYTLWFFIFTALAFLVKWTAVVYFGFPIVITLVMWIRSTRGKGTPQLIFNLFLGGIVFLVITLPWYVSNLQTLLGYITYYGPGIAEYRKAFWSMDNLTTYFKLVTMFQIHFVGLFFFLVSSYIHWKKEKRVLTYWVFGFIVFYYLFFTYVNTKTIRYLMPIMPFYAMVMAYGLDWLLDKGEKKHTFLLSFSSFIIVYSVISYFILSFGIPIYPKYKYAANFPVIGWVDVYYFHTYPTRALYNAENWQNQAIAQAILEDPNYDEIRRLLVVNDLPFLGPSTVNIRLYEQNGSQPYLVRDVDTNFGGILKGNKQFPDEQSLKDYIHRSYYVVVTRDSIGPKEAMFDYDVRYQIQQYFMSGRAKEFETMAVYPLPDGNAVYLFKKKKM